MKIKHHKNTSVSTEKKKTKEKKEQHGGISVKSQGFIFLNKTFLPSSGCSQQQKDGFPVEEVAVSHIVLLFFLFIIETF